MNDVARVALDKIKNLSFSVESSDAESRQQIELLFSDPNPLSDFKTVVANHIASLSENGESFIYVISGQKFGKPCELWNIRTSSIRPSSQYSEHYPAGSWLIDAQGDFGLSGKGLMLVDGKGVICHKMPKDDNYLSEISDNSIARFISEFSDLINKNVISPSWDSSLTLSA